MFAAGQTDVKEGTANPGASSTSNAEASQAQGSQTLATSAETLKTESEVHESHVPYERFKEVNDKYRKIAEETKQYLENKAFYESYEKFDQMLAAKPELMEAIQKALLNQGTVQSEQVQQAIQQGDPLAQQVAYNMYISEFNRIAQAKGIPEKLMPYYGEFTRAELLKINPYPLANFNLQMLPVAFENAAKHIDAIRMDEKATYVENKKSDAAIPASGTTSASSPTRNEQLDTQDKRRDYIANALRAAT
jgi:hypothetical protein